MTRNVKWTVLGLMAGLSAFSVSHAWAGMKATWPSVTVSTGSTGSAGGALGTARNTGDANQYIGCSVVGSPGNPASVYCWAVDASGNSGNCYNPNNANMVATVASINSDSYIYFRWNSDGTCSMLQVENSSFFAPKGP
jgi:hypothetical protein